MLFTQLNTKFSTVSPSTHSSIQPSIHSFIHSSIHQIGKNLKSNVKNAGKIRVKGKTLQKVTLFTYIDFFSFFKDKKSLQKQIFSKQGSLQVLTSFVSIHLGLDLVFNPQTGQKYQSVGFSQWFSAMLSLTTSGHQSSTKLGSSFAAESHPPVAVSGIHEDSERRAMVSRSRTWTHVKERDGVTASVITV